VKYPSGVPTGGTSPAPSASLTATAQVPQPSAAPPTPSQPAPSVAPTATATPRPAADPRAGCDPSYPTICLPPPPPNLDCGQIPYRNFPVKKPDPHRFDNDNGGCGCAS